MELCRKGLHDLTDERNVIVRRHDRLCGPCFREYQAAYQRRRRREAGVREPPRSTPEQRQEERQRSGMQPDGRSLLVGDMNDTPDSQPLRSVSGQAAGLVNALVDPTETRPAKADQPPPPPSKAWTHRFKEGGQPPDTNCSIRSGLARLAPRQSGAFIDRRTRHGGVGSDHDPAWVVLDL
jgi:hypothetical protein